MSQRVLAMVLTLMMTGCIGAGDMFAPSKQVVGPYELFRRESGSFAIGGPGKPAADAGGYIDGMVDSLGWTSDYLLVRRARPLVGGELTGWFVIDVHSGTVTGPLSASERAANPTLARIALRSADAVWEQ